MRRLVDKALTYRVVVVALAAILIVIGARIAEDAPFDVFPEFAPTLVEIQIEAPGLSTPEVENLVTIPIENVLNGISFLATIRSKTVLGLSSVVLIFEEGTDLWRARQIVQERVAAITTLLPDVASTPVVLPPLSATSRMLKIGMSSSTLTQMELSTLAVWTIRPRLMAVPGVANVAIWGQQDRQLQALVEPDRLRAGGVTLDEVVSAGQRALFVGAGGFVDTANQRLAVLQRQPVQTPADLADVVVAYRNGAVIRVGDVSDVVEGHQPMIGDAIINDGPGLLLIVEKQPWGNTFEVTRDVEAALDALRPGLAGVELDSTIFRPATFIRMSLENLRSALSLGIVLVVMVLFAFLYEWRTAAISVVAIPLSLLAAATVLYYRGGTINTMILAGLIIALGEVVDDAIIDVENIVRRLRLEASAPNPRPAHRVVLDASLEVRSAVVYGSMIVVLVFVPVFFLGGLSGSFFRPLALSYVLAILASLAVALTVTPALSLLLLPGAVGTAGDAPVVGWLKRRYRRILPRILAARRLVVPAMVIVIVAALSVVPFLGEEFLPDFKEYDFLMHWVEKPGTSLEAMRRITVRASRELRAIEGVRNFGAHIGRAEVADEVVGPNFTELWISMDPDVDYDATLGQIQEVVNGYPGLFRDVLTYLKERIKEVLTGASATIVVRVYGPDLDGLRDHADRVQQAMATVAGVADLHVEQQEEVPQLVVRPRQAVLSQYGLTAGEVRRAATTLIAGVKVGEIYEQQMTLDVVVWGAESIRNDVEDLRRLRIDTPGGAHVPLGDLAEVRIAPSPNAILREGSSRRIDITCNVVGRALGAVATDVEAAVGNVVFDQGYHPEFLGEYVEQRAARNRLLALSLLSALGILLILHADFGSFRVAGLIFASLPFALIGSVAAVLVTGGVLSLGSLVGFVTVLGIAGRNGIMLISHYRHLQFEEGVPFGPELITRGAEERLAPILMTALTTMLALVPIVAGGNRPGHEIEHPMAVVIIGGLVTSTLLNVLLVPALYSRYGAPKTDLPGESA